MSGLKYTPERAKQAASRYAYARPSSSAGGLSFNQGCLISIVILLLLIFAPFLQNTIFTPLMYMYDNIILGGTEHNFHNLAVTKALEEVTKSSFDEIHTDKFIIKVNDSEILCTVYCDEGPAYRFRAGIIPYHNEEDSAGPIYTRGGQLVGRKIVLKFSPHGNSSFTEFTKSFFAAPNEDGYCVLEPFENYAKRQRMRQEQRRIQQEAEKKEKEEQKKREEEQQIRKVQE